MSDSTELEGRVRQPAYRRIADGVRTQILTGKYAPECRLPSTEELALTWRSSYFTVHTALKALVKEGWVERVHGSGTYVADRKNRFVCAGIYHGSDICSNAHPPFVRSVHVALLEQFARLKKETQIFIDTRPESRQDKILPALAEAILNRRIQCLVAPTLNSVDAPGLARLALPTAFINNPSSPNQIDYDREHFFRESARRLAAQGCRSVGLISSLHIEKGAGTNYDQFYRHFHQAARREKLATQSDWIGKPAHYAPPSENLGYEQFHRLSRLGKKPDGLIVYPDTIVRGVVTAVLELGLREVSRQMKFVFHRNAHIDYLCPFPVTWAISDEWGLAEGLIQLIKSQFRAERISPVALPFLFKTDEALDPAGQSLAIQPGQLKVLNC